jgi:hypothetical protein
MGAKWEAKLPEEFTHPAQIGLYVVLATVVVLFLISKWNAKKLPLGGKGSRFVLDPEDGIVRRSARSVKKPVRFEPVLKGQGAEMSPSKDSPGSPVVQKLSPRLAKTPRVVSDAVKSVVEDSPVVKRGPGRPRKNQANGSASPPTSPMRSRRGPKSPSK